jgi:hypothetical protein
MHPPFLRSLSLQMRLEFRSQAYTKGGVGVGCIGFDEQGVVISAFQFFWSKNFVSWKDSKGAEMGSKTTTLEILGVLCNVILNLE